MSCDTKETRPYGSIFTEEILEKRKVLSADLFWKPLSGRFWGLSLWQLPDAAVPLCLASWGTLCLESVLNVSSSTHKGRQGAMAEQEASALAPCSQQTVCSRGSTFVPMVWGRPVLLWTCFCNCHLKTCQQKGAQLHRVILFCLPDSYQGFQKSYEK